jgi:SAM-dependent methyltransferase
MDEVYRYNKERWESLVQARALWTRPWLDLDPGNAIERVDPWGYLGDVRGKHVLCLAGGGGRQSTAFALAGARVTVLDLADGQLTGDREAAAHYGYEVTTVQGDMRDLSGLEADSFDLVYHPYSINFVPDCRTVFAEVARVLRLGGRYIFQAANPFVPGVGTSSWNGHAYELRGRYEQGETIEYGDEDWVYGDSPDRPSIPRAREYRHLLGTLVNGLLDQGFALERIEEETAYASADSEPGSWPHLIATVPPWLFFWTRLDAKTDRA